MERFGEESPVLDVHTDFSILRTKTVETRVQIDGISDTKVMGPDDPIVGFDSTVGLVGVLVSSTASKHDFADWRPTLDQ